MPRVRQGSTARWTGAEPWRGGLCAVQVVALKEDKINTLFVSVNLHLPPVRQFIIQTSANQGFVQNGSFYLGCFCVDFSGKELSLEKNL